MAKNGTAQGKKRGGGGTISEGGGGWGGRCILGDKRCYDAGGTGVVSKKEVHPMRGGGHIGLG